MTNHLRSKKEPQPPPKKPLSEKQIAALAKAQETRKRKREEKLAEEAIKLAAKKAQADKQKIVEEQKAAKKALANERRKQARLAKKGGVTGVDGSTYKPSTPSETSSETSLEKTIDKEVDALTKENKPPAWFKEFVKSVKHELSASTPSQIKKSILLSKLRTNQILFTKPIPARVIGIPIPAIQLITP